MAPKGLSENKKKGLKWKSACPQRPVRWHQPPQPSSLDLFARSRRSPRHNAAAVHRTHVCIHVMCVYMPCLRAIHDFHHSHRILGKDHWPPHGRKHNCTEVHFRLSPHVTGSQLHPEGQLRKQDTIGTPEDTKDWDFCTATCLSIKMQVLTGGGGLPTLVILM